MKRISILLPALVAAMSLFPSVKIDDLYYDLYYNPEDDLGRYAIVTYQYKNSEANYMGLTRLQIPAKVGYDGYDYTVLGIGEGAFQKALDLTSVYCGAYVREIGKKAFDHSSASYVQIRDSCITVRDSAFAGCAQLATVSIGKSVQSFGMGVFTGCDALNEVEWNVKNFPDFAGYSSTPFFRTTYNEETHSTEILYDLRQQITKFSFGNQVASIPAFLCTGMENVTEINLPSSVKRIGKQAFKTTGLTSISIGENVAFIGEEAFKSAQKLTSVVWKAKRCEDFSLAYTASPFGISAVDVKSFSFGDQVEYIPHGLCFGMSSLTDVVLSNSIEEIGDGAFKDCAGLRSITTGERVAQWGEDVFLGCTALENVTWNVIHSPDFLSSAATPFNRSNSYDLTKQITTFTFGNKVEYIPNYLCYQMGNLTSLTIPNSVTEMGKYVFSYCKGLTSPSLSIGQNVKNIGYYAFSYCEGLTTIELPESVTKIENGAFAFCSGLTTVVIADNVEQIGVDAFRNCSSLKDLTIGEGVTSIGSGAFSECNALTSVTWNAVNCADLEQPFQAAKEITTFLFGDKVEHVPATLCYEMSHLTNLTLPATATSIGRYAFAYCTGLGDVVLPTGVTVIDDGVFEGSDLKAITLHDGVTEIGSEAFRSTSISSVDLPAGLTTIGEGAFIWCYLVKSITVDNKNTVYDSREGCNAIIETATNKLLVGCMNSVVPASITAIGDYAFYGSQRMTSITLPKSITSIGDAAFAECYSMAVITCEATEVPALGKYAFAYVSSPVYVPAESVEAYKAAAQWEDMDIRAIVPGSFRRIKIGDLYYDLYPDKTAHVVPDTYSLINYLDLTNADIPATVTHEGEIYSVIAIDDYTFAFSEDIKSITFGENIETVGDAILLSCNGLTTVVWNAKNCADFDEFASPFLRVKDGVDDYDLTENITSFTFGEGIEHIPANLCSYFINIGELTIPESVTSIGEYAFWGAAGLGEVVMPAGVTVIEKGVFRGSDIKAITLHEGVKEIKDEAFGWSGLASYVVCKAEEPPTMGEDVFYHVDCSKIPLYVPFVSLEAYQTAEQWKEFYPIEPFDPHFLITFVNWDGKDLQTDYVLEGTLPEYTGATPERPADENYSYTFKGWTPELTAVTADATYTATYKKKAPLAFNPTEVKASIDLDWNYPTLLNPDKLTVTYTSSNPDVATVETETGAVTLVAEGTTTITAAFAGNDDYMPCQASYQLTVEPRVWTVIYLDWNEALLDIEEVKNGDDAKGITVSREGYTFTGWSQSIENVTEDLIVKAQYEINTYTVRFFDNDGKQIGADQVINWNEAAVEPNDEDIPAVEGHTFTGWDKDFDHVKSDLDIKALYEINTYIVYFYDMVGNQLGETQIIEYGKAAVAPEAPAVEGYHFTGWDKDFGAVKSDLIVNATYEKNVYTVTFVDKDDNVLKEEKVKWDEAATAPSAPSWEGHTFTGWDTDFNHVKSDLTVKPIYDTKLYTVRFIDWNGKELKAEKVEYGAGATAPKAPEREGYTFAGWDKAFDLITEDLTVKATYTVNVYTVTFVDKESKAIGEAQKVEYGKAAVAPEAPAVEGYHFTGWDKDFSVVKGDMTIQATYEINLYTVTFIGFAGATINFQHVQHGDAAVEPEQPLVHGYHFTGWDKDFSYITSDLVVYAIYEEDDYTPQNLSVTLLPKGDDLQIIFSWDKVDGAASYEVMLAEGGKELGTKNTVGQNIVPIFLSAIVKEYHITPGTYTLDWSVRSTDDLGAPISEWAAGKAFEVTIKDTGTGMESIQHSAVSIQKVLRDGALFIIVGDRIYDAAGRLVK